MATALKQRIVGAIVIVCVLAIFLPVLLHKSKTQTTQQVPMPIPSPSTLSQISLQLPAQPAGQAVAPVHAAPAAPTPTQKVVALEKAVVEPPIRPRAQLAKTHPAPVQQHYAHAINTKILQSAVSTPQAWVVQLGSFSQVHNATKLVKTLRKRGFDAYTRVGYVKQRRITCVFVGPEIHHSTIEKISARLYHDLHIKGFVRKYQV